jgi:hypothetical protein
MVDISYNFPNKGTQTSCICGEDEDMLHIYNCDILNTNNQGPFQKFQQNLEKREKIISESKPTCDPHGSAVLQ